MCDKLVNGNSDDQYMHIMEDVLLRLDCLHMVMTEMLMVMQSYIKCHSNH